MYIRMDTFIKLRLTNLLLNETHGPNISTNMKQPILTFILNANDRKEGSGRGRGGLKKKKERNVEGGDEDEYDG